MSTDSFSVIVATVFLAIGVVGYSLEKRRGAERLRRLRIWYAFALPVLAIALLGFAHPKIGWLRYVELGIVIVGYGCMALDTRRHRAALRRQAESPMSGGTPTGP
jgi:hypothetical protein